MSRAELGSARHPGCRGRLRTPLVSTGGYAAHTVARLAGIPSSKYYDWCERYGRPNAHNAQVPRQFWLLPKERQAILNFELEHPDEDYRRLCFMMLDDDIVAASPSSVYRILRNAGRIGPQDQGPSSKGCGFDQPSQAHAHWHVIVADLVHTYNSLRLHSDIGYVTPQARLEGRDQHILADRRRKLAAARLTRHAAHHQPQPG